MVLPLPVKPDKNMSSRTKLILQISAFVAAVVLIIWGIWAVFFRAPGAPIIPFQAPEVAPGGLPTIGPGGAPNLAPEAGVSLLEPEPAPQAKGPDTVAQGGLTETQAITNTRAEFSAYTSTGFSYYNENDGRFYRLSSGGGEPVLLSDEAFNSVQNVSWASSGDKAVLEFPDGSNIFYDFKTKDKATLPRDGQEFSFSASGEALAYEYIGQGESDRWIVASQPNGEGRQLVQPLGNEAHNTQIAWSPDNQVVAMYREPTSALGEEIFFIGLNDENFLSLQTNGLGFKGKWSPTGEQLLYSVYSERTNYNPALYIAGAKGDNVGAGNRSLKVATWPDKCVFASETLVYCAVPQDLPQGSGMYPELAASATDSIYKIDLKSNLASLAAIPSSGDNSSFNVTNLMISGNGDELYFTDRVSGVLRRLRLR